MNGSRWVLAVVVGWISLVSVVPASDQNPRERQPQTNSAPTSPAQDTKNRSGTSKSSAPATSPSQALLQQSIDQMRQVGTIQTEVQIKVELFDKSFVSKGRYLKGADDLAMRLELQMDMSEYLQVPGSSSLSSFSMGCDGDTLTISEQVLGLESQFTFNVKEILSALVEVKKENLRPVVIDLLGIFSMPSLLRGINDTMDGEKWIRMESMEAEYKAAHGREVYVLQGEWKEIFKQRYLPPPTQDDEKPKNDPTSKAKDQEPAPKAQSETMIPRHVPTHVLLTLDRQSGFPYRIDYRHRNARRQRDKSVILLEFLQPKFGEPLENTEFFLLPSNDAQDLTGQWVQRIQFEGDLGPLEDLARSGGSPLRLVLPELQQEQQEEQ